MQEKLWFQIAVIANEVKQSPKSRGTLKRLPRAYGSRNDGSFYKKSDLAIYLLPLRPKLELRLEALPPALLAPPVP